MMWNQNDTKYIIKRLILYLIISGIVFFGASKCANALTLGSWNINQYYNGNNHTYNLYPNAFKYQGEWFNTFMGNYSDLIYWGTNGYTTSMNYHFDNPCQVGEPYTYSQRLNFYRQGPVELSLSSLRVVSGVDECSGSWNYNGTIWQYVYQCTFKDGVPRSSWYFDWSSVAGIEWYDDIQYRVGIADTTITCQLNTGAIIENDNNNTNRIINSQEQNAQHIVDEINNQTEAIDNLNDNIMTDFEFDNSSITVITDIISTGDKNKIRDFLMFPIRLLMIVMAHIGNYYCYNFNLGSLLGTNLILPCIDIQSIIGTNLYNTIDIIFATCIYIGIVIYIRKLLDYLFSLGATSFDNVNVEVFN